MVALKKHGRFKIVLQTCEITNFDFKRVCVCVCARTVQCLFTVETKFSKL